MGTVAGKLHFWFVGVEPGGDELDACVRMWEALGKAELLDVVADHKEHERDLFGVAAAPQRTWQKLIWLLLAYKGLDPTPQATLSYQEHELGRLNKDTALIEISALPAVNNASLVARELFREHRTAVIHERMLHYKPTFVVFYSPDRRYGEAWNEISGHTLVRDTPVLTGPTACVMTYHPNGEWSKAYWISIAHKIKQLERLKCS